MRLNGDNFVIDKESPITIPVSESEPLKDEMQAFIQSCEIESPALTDIAEGIAVQQVLEQMQSSLIDTSSLIYNP